MIGLFHAEENWRGKHAWLAYKRQLETQGEKLDFNDFIPPAVPDDKNFAMTPLLAPLFDFNPRPLKPGQSNWRDTNGYHRAIAFGGDFLSLADRLPTPRNRFQMTDLRGWAVLLTGNSNALRLDRSEAAGAVLEMLDRRAPELEELHAASRRPFARFNVRYDEDLTARILLPHLAVLRSAAERFQLRASAELALGKTGLALADVEMALYLSDTVKDEPFLISKLVEFAIIQSALQPIWEGLAEHRWSDAQLDELRQRLARLTPLTDVGMRGERASILLTVDQVRILRGKNTGLPFDAPPTSFAHALYAMIPAGWFYQNQLVVARLWQECMLPAYDTTRQRFLPSVAEAGAARLRGELREGVGPSKFFARMMLPDLVTAERRFAHIQTRINLAAIACALERYRLAEGRYPETLDALSPRFLERIPRDVINGDPLKYRVNDAGQFILYSVGWNETDDGGTVPLAPSGKAVADLAKGDWIWDSPAK